MDEQFARYPNAVGDRLISIVWPGTRVQGLAVSMEAGMLTFIPDGDGRPSFVPLDAISKIERFSARHSRGVAVGSGIAAGFGAWFAAFIAAFAGCGDNSRCLNRVAPLIFGGPVVLGAVAGWAVRGAAWHPISAANLQIELTRTHRP